MKLIHKYSNRRMYDTEESRVVTLEDISKLIRDDIDFKVIDKTTGEDITSNVLLQTLLKIDQNDTGDTKIKNVILKTLIKEYIEKPFSILKTAALAGIGIADLSVKDIDFILKYLVNHGKKSRKDGADIVRDYLEKTGIELQKGAEDFADNVSKTIYTINMMSKPINKKPKEQKSTPKKKNKNIKDKHAENKPKTTEDKNKESKIKELEQQIQELQSELDKLKSDDKDI